MKKRFKILPALFVGIVLIQFSCGTDELVVQGALPATVQVQKDPEMIRFEKSIAGMGSKYNSHDQKISREAKDIVTASAENYLNFYGKTTSKDATEGDILSQALKLHDENMKRLRNNQTTNK